MHAVMDRDRRDLFYRKVLLFTITIVLAWVIAEVRRYRRQKEEAPGRNQSRNLKADRDRPADGS